MFYALLVLYLWRTKPNYSLGFINKMREKICCLEANKLNQPCNLNISLSLFSALFAILNIDWKMESLEKEQQTNITKKAMEEERSLRTNANLRSSHWNIFYYFWFSICFSCFLFFVFLVWFETKKNKHLNHKNYGIIISLISFFRILHYHNS